MQNENKNPRKGLYILLSVLIAVGFWIYVDEYGDNGNAHLVQQEVTDIPVEYIGEELLADRGMMLINSGTTEHIDLILEGTRRLVTKLDRNKVRLVADLSEVTTPGIQTINYVINFSDPKFSGSAIDVKHRSNNRATVNISELNSKEVEVRCELIGNVAEGYSAGQIQLSHDTVEVRGLAQDIDPVSYVKITLNLGKDAVESISQSLECQFYDKRGYLLENNGIHPSVDSIEATLPVYVTKEIQLAVAFKEYPGANSDNLEFKISPPSIVVSGEATKLKGVDRIVLGEFDLLDLVGHDSATHSFPIIIPDSCQNLSGVTRAGLEVKFKDMATATVPTSLYQYTNLPENKIVTILSEDIPIRIFGTHEDVAAVTGENITAIMDLSDYSGAIGTYTVPVTIDIVTPGDIGVRGSYEVQIKISEEVIEDEPSENPEE